MFNDWFDTNQDFDGYWFGASRVLTGEMRPYSKKSGTFSGAPIARTLYQGGKGARNVSARWSNFDFSDGLLEGDEMGIAPSGVNWWLAPIICMGLNYRYVWNARPGAEGASSGSSTRELLLLE